jgi:hypothetical protein
LRLAVPLGTTTVWASDCMTSTRFPRR